MVYRVRNWKKLYETAETRKLKRLAWVPVPNKHDGRGYRRILRLQDGPLVFAAWVLILQVASRCTPRGVLADDDGPLAPIDLADKTGYPVEYFEKAFKALCSKDIGWMECVNAAIGYSGGAGESPATPGDHPAIAVAKGREGNRSNVKRLPATPALDNNTTAYDNNAHSANGAHGLLFGQPVSNAKKRIKSTEKGLETPARTQRDKKPRLKSLDGEVFAMLTRPYSLSKCAAHDVRGFGLTKIEAGKAGRMIKGNGGSWSAHKLAALEYALRDKNNGGDWIALARGHMKGKTATLDAFNVMVDHWASWLRLEQARVRAHNHSIEQWDAVQDSEARVDGFDDAWDRDTGEDK